VTSSGAMFYKDRRLMLMAESAIARNVRVGFLTVHERFPVLKIFKRKFKCACRPFEIYKLRL
jgi:hypothetical protein